MELCEALLEGFIRAVLRGILNKINNLGGVNTVESSHTVVKLGYTAGHTSDGKLGLCLSKPNSSIICPELWKFDYYSVDVKGEGSLGSGDSGRGFGQCQDRFSLAERKHGRLSKLEAGRYEESKDCTQINYSSREARL